MFSMNFSLTFRPKGDAKTSSEWSIILLPTKAWLILEIWLYVNTNAVAILITYGIPMVSPKYAISLSKNIPRQRLTIFS